MRPGCPGLGERGVHLHLFTSQKPFSGPGLQPGFGSLLPQRCVAKKWRGVGVLRVSRMNTGRTRFSECHSGEAVVSGAHRLLGEVRRGSASRCLASGLWVAASWFSSPSRQVPRGPWGLQMPPQSTAIAKVKGKGRSWRKPSAHGRPRRATSAMQGDAGQGSPTHSGCGHHI